MLMYRQIRSDNCVFMKEEELPQHVRKLVTKLEDDELKERELRDFKKSICKVSSIIGHLFYLIVFLFCAWEAVIYAQDIDPQSLRHLNLYY